MLHRVVDVALAVAPRHVVDVMHAVAAVALHLVVGVVILRRNVLLPDRLNKHLTPGPSAHYDAYLVSRSWEFPDISLKDDPVSFVEYAYSVTIT